MVDYRDILILSAILFSIGIFGVMIRRNAVVVFMCLEFMLNAGIMVFVAFAAKHGHVDGLIPAFFVIVLAACEAVIGLAIFIAMFRLKKSLHLDDFSELKY